ncbi:MAG TPA: prolipoprotein diacylglyceryl transferase [Fibrobacteria bacterium]|nr:prolipoprotein diacylglyceryl transferase [Fibrobacteria bacterium]
MGRRSEQKAEAMGGFLYWWQHLPARMDPVLFSLGPLRVQWYGLMYIIAFAVTYVLARRRCLREDRFKLYDEEFLKNLLTYAFIGVLAGGRLGYVLFYNLHYYLAHPLEIILPFGFAGGFHFTGISGMSYHGGVTGAIAGSYFYCRRFKADFWNLCDLFFPIAPLGYTCGRLGNFINGELWGRATIAPIGMYFPLAPDSGTLRHPSQLYEAFFEGVFLFMVFLFLRKLRLPKGAMSAAYLFGYGFVRFFIEFFREPDKHLGFVLLGKFSRGQELCALMMLLGTALFVYLKVRKTPAGPLPAG